MKEKTLPRKRAEVYGEQRKGPGQGSAALLGDNVMESSEEKSSLYLPISQVESCAGQPRKQFDPDALADLADSIRSTVSSSR